MVTDNDLVVPKNDAELIEMERLMRSAPEPGGLPSGPLGEDGVTVHSAKAVTAGHVTMWNTDTREPSVFNLNAVRTKLREVFPADYEVNPSMRGKPCWTSIQPSAPPFRGGITCLLHPNRPEREEFDQLGYPRCYFDICANEMEARRHLEKKHPGVHRMMQESRDNNERDANIKNQDTMGQILAHLSGTDLTAEPAPLEVPVGFETFEVIADSPTISTAETNITPTHAHSFPKAMGSSCKTVGCDVIRLTPFKSRKKK